MIIISGSPETTRDIRMKNLSPRQREIFNLLESSGHLKAEEIRSAFKVSQATAYREMDNLARQGIAAKIPGGIAKIEQEIPGRCIQCKRESRPNLAFGLHTEKGEKLNACCPHCGLMALETHPAASAFTTDFFYGTIINAAQAWYVLESLVNPCCSPSVLTFANREDANRFAEAFNGKLADFSQARQHNHKLMHFS